MADRRAFIKDIGWNALGFGVIPFIPGMDWATSDWTVPGKGLAALPRSAPEQQGVLSADILRWLDAIKASGQEFHSIMIVRHGHVIAEGWWYPYSATHKQQLYSLSKSFTGTAIGLAMDEKKLTIEDSVLSFFPDDVPRDITDNLVALKVKHLLSMSVGQAKDSIEILEHSPTGVRWEKTFLSLPIVYEPGTQFLYNSGASYMLSSIVKKVTGQSAHAFLGPRLYTPLGISGATWTENAEGVNMGASHLRIKTEDIAKLGQLYLQKGIWKGQRILSQEWVGLATKKEIETGKNDGSWNYGYGYQFWMNPPGGFRADGAYGQYGMVFPDKDAVVAITSESVDKAATMQTVWDHLYPAFGTQAPLPPHPGDLQKLRTTLGSLAFKPPVLATQAPLAHMISGKRFLLDQNPFQARALSYRFLPDRVIFTLEEEGKPDIVIHCGWNRWIIGNNRKPAAHSLFSLRRIDFDSPVAASAGWSDDQTLVLTFRFIETVHGDTLTCQFKDDTLRIKFLFSAARLEKRPDDRADITGRIVA